MRSRRGSLVVGSVALVFLTISCQPPPTPGAKRLPDAPNCPLFPANSYWDADVSRLPVDSRSSTWVASAGAGSPLHADFGSGTYNGGPIGIPYVTVPGDQPRVAITFAPTRATPAPTPSRPPRRSRAARRAPATATCSSSTATAAGCGRRSPPTRTATALGEPARA